jgi:tetratricopeptide (TPR) repeat protein
MTLWVNPQPEKQVVSVRFSTPTRQPVVGLVGLTAIVKKGADNQAAQLAQAKELLKQARQALKDNKTDQAKTLLKQALAAAPNLMEAHQLWADLCEKDGKDEQTLEAYRQWTRAGAQTPMPWNRLGELLEKRKDYKGALEAYRQSLKIEWNQPPALEAKSRLEKLVGQ